MTEAFNIDCMEFMKTIPDGYYDLAVVDPPYGGSYKADNGTRFGGRFRGYAVERRNGTTKKYDVTRTGGRTERYNSGDNITRFGGQWAAKYKSKIIEWDKAPEPAYFDELFRVSKNQIIWGGNYFELPPNRCFIVWYKPDIPVNFTMSNCEYAWCSFNDNAKVFVHNASGQQERFHPTQKPVALYEWIYSHYAKAGDKILDTHLGSGSSRIAAQRCGLDFTGCEIDKDYFESQERRFEIYGAQTSLFDSEV